MNLHYADLASCADAQGVVVVIDVCRAFTAAACAFAQGAERVILAGTPEEALALREKLPGALLMGEIEGLPAPGFDLWNSPAQVSQLDLSGRTLVQRTSSGTQGIVRASRAARRLAASFMVASATARAIRALDPPEVTFVITGGGPDPRYGLEDRACADYIAVLLRGEQPDPRDFMGWIGDWFAVHHIDSWPEPLRTTIYTDLAFCRAVDRCAFAMPVELSNGMLLMRKETA